jgi:uncharacterized protein YqgV (UPF0045/DUF77 family)
MSTETQDMLTAELSLYPLADDYLPPIKAFIEALNRESGLEVRTNATSTHLRGPHDRVFNTCRDLLRASRAAYGRQILVCKFLPGDYPLD